jgi:hypothetical protein
METILKCNFETAEDNSYPDGWLCEQNSELPYKLGAVLGGEFCLMGKGNRHFPLIPATKNFKMDFNVRGDHFYGTMGLEIYFCYDFETRKGWVLRLDWGICGGQTNREQRGLDEYICELFRYQGRKTFGKYHSVFRKTVPGYVKDLSLPQKISLKCDNSVLTFAHGDSVPISIPIPPGFSDTGVIALDQSHSREIWYMDKKGAHRISALTISSDYKVSEEESRPETKTEFPPDINGIISPYYFHISAVVRNGLSVLRAKLTGGPSKEPLYPDIDRCRFGEKMFNPYIRIENTSGEEIGKFLIAKGSVGLTDFDWNIKTSVMSPADFECPLEREIDLSVLPADARIFIGYDRYESEDSICLDGGPSEALIDSDGKVIFSGPRLLKGEARFSVASQEDKEICTRIPKDIPFYDDALSFAKRNHFFILGEKIMFRLNLFSRDENITLDSIKAIIGVEDVFGGKISRSRQISFKKSVPLAGLKGSSVMTTGYFTLPELNVWVYHIRVKISGAALPEQRIAFEVMPKNPKDLSAPLVSGLPRLYPNILSGIKGEHFHPWSNAISDVCHYNSGGNNYYKVVRKWRAPELLHLYGREWICWLKPWKTVYDERGIASNKDLIEQADAAFSDMPRYHLWAPERYQIEFVFNSLLEFLKSDEFTPVENGILTYETVSARAKERGITREQFLELLNGNWKKWLMFFTAKNMALLKSKSESVIQINSECKPFMFAPFHPVYASSYKSGYFPFYLGMDPRGLDGLLPGPNGFEDYPYSSGYAIARGTYQLASCKMEAPKTKLYPEVFGINGETLDPRVVFANPPLGQSDPPPGFLTKQFYEYSFAAVWFDKSSFNFWSDHGYYPKTWDRENYQEMLNAYAFISKTKPVKPLRTSAFIFSRAACLEHPDYYDTDDDLFFNGSVINTAEECVAYAYEQARAAGHLAGFTAKLEDVALLNPADIDTLVLPPLCGVSDELKCEIRRLFSQGVAVLGFEDVSGLEDLFGIEKAPEVKSGKIIPGDHPSAKALDGMSEKTEHELCIIRHRLAGANTLLKSEDGNPVLTIYGKAAFFTLPPTFVNRAKTMTPAYGQQSKSTLVNKAAQLAMFLIGDKEVECSDGTLIGFRDMKGDAHIIISEDRCPEKGRSIRPLVKIKIKDIKKRDISSDKEFELIEINSKEVLLRFSLKAYETAKIKIRNQKMAAVRITKR